MISGCLSNVLSLDHRDDRDDRDDGDYRQTSELLKPAIRRQKHFSVRSILLVFVFPIDALNIAHFLLADYLTNLTMTIFALLV